MNIELDGNAVFVGRGGVDWQAGLPTLFMQHGAGMNRTVWVLLGRYFARHGYNVVLADLPGHGNSAGAPLPSIEANAEWLWRLLEALAILPNLANCTPDGGHVDPDIEYRFHPANAVAVPQSGSNQASNFGIQKEKTLMGEGDSRNASIHPDGMTADKGILVSGATLIAMAQLDFNSADTLEEAKKIMRPLLRVQLGDRPLKSRELFEALARNK